VHDLLQELVPGEVLHLHLHLHLHLPAALHKHCPDRPLTHSLALAVTSLQIHPSLEISIHDKSNSNIDKLRQSFSSCFGGLDLHLVLSLFTGSRVLQDLIQMLPE
jgi:hypothetical protein